MEPTHIQVIFLFGHGPQHGFIATDEPVTCDDGVTRSAAEWSEMSGDGIVTVASRRGAERVVVKHRMAT